LASETIVKLFRLKFVLAHQRRLNTEARRICDQNNDRNLQIRAAYDTVSFGPHDHREVSRYCFAGIGFSRPLKVAGFKKGNDAFEHFQNNTKSIAQN